MNTKSDSISLSKIKRFIYSFVLLFLFYSICLNHSFTSDQVGAWNYAHGKVSLTGIASTLVGGRFMSAILSVVGWLFSKIGVTVYQNQYVFKLIIIAVAAYAVYKMYELFSPFLNSKIKSVVMLSILAVSFANPYYVETFVYTGFEWSVGLLLAVWSVYLFKDKKYVRSALVVFLAITTYQSYVVIFLILTTVYIYLKNDAKSKKTAWISYLRMLLIAGIPAVADILIVKISVAVMNFVNADKIASGSMAQTSEVKPVVMSTGIAHRIYLMCAAYFGSTCTCFGMLPFGIIFIMIALMIIISLIYMFRHGKKWNELLYYVLISAMVNAYPVAIYFVMGGESLGIVCRVVWPIFMTIAMMILITIYIIDDDKWLNSVIIVFSCFMLVNIYCTQTTAMDFFISNKLDANEMNQIEAEIERYETSSGNKIEYIETAYTDNALENDYSQLLCQDYQTWTFHRKTTHNSWSTVELLNYVTGENYQKKDMNKTVYNKCFAGKTWNEFIPEEQLVFDGNTMYWAIY